MGIMIGIFPIILILIVLVLAGISWLFHHHHWRPFAGIFLFVIGAGVFTLLMGRASVQVERQAPTPARYDPRRMNPDTSTNFTGARFKTETVRQGTYVDGIVAERSDPSTGSTKLAEVKTAEKAAAARSPASDSTTKVAEHPPAWISRSPHPEQGDDGQRIYVAAVASERYATPAECDQAIIPAINKIVARYVSEYLSNAPDGDLTLDADYIRSNLIKDEYWEQVDTSVGPMHQLHDLLVFDSHVRNELESRARLAKVDGRLKYAAAGTALTLLVLGGIYSLLRRGDRGRSSTAKAI